MRSTECSYLDIPFPHLPGEGLYEFNGGATPSASPSPPSPPPSSSSSSLSVKMNVGIYARICQKVCQNICQIESQLAGITWRKYMILFSGGLTLFTNAALVVTAKCVKGRFEMPTIYRVLGRSYLVLQTKYSVLESGVRPKSGLHFTK